MKLNTLDLKMFLPQFMLDDISSTGMIYAIQNQLQYIIQNIYKIQIYNNIDNLGNQLLDELAFQFNVPEYNVEFEIDIKRSIIKNCMDTHRKRGTVKAVEDVITNVFGNGYVEEWFEYDGQPFKFKVHSSNASINDDMLNEFERVLYATQNLRSLLESVIVELNQEMNLNIGFYLHSTENIYFNT